MLQIYIPGRGELEIEELIMDYNGTLAYGGEMIEGLDEKLITLSEILKLTLLTADTFGTAETECSELPLRVEVVEHGLRGKEEYLARNVKHSYIGIGNGNNDYHLLKQAAIGILVMGSEGCATQALSVADLLIGSPEEALELIINPRRLVSTLHR